MNSSIAADGLRLADPTEARGRIGLASFCIIALQLGLVLLLLRQFEIESKAFVQLAGFAFAGFAVHAFLPLRWRLPFFAGLGLASIPIVLGQVNGAWLVGVGFVLIGICHLPLSARARLLLLLGAGAVLMAQRAGLLPAPWPEAIWPILGSIFMFRLIVYFYDLRYDTQPVTPAQSVGYFFMLPNACFPLFPVIDFKTWRRSHYSADAYETYQRGIDWIVRGVIHLILYRLIYYHVTLAPAEVSGPAQLLQYLVSNFLLYLRVSGLFHLVVGMLHLFGFKLPETHNRYLLAASFTDFWRRINIYWKDFMQKVFYFPAVFALKRFGTTGAVIGATMFVFVLTWFLHSYQWFWLRGSWLLAPQDILFWSLLGVLVVVNSLYEIRFGRKRRLGTPAWNWRSYAVLVAKTYAMFWFICVLWSFWTAESVHDWLALWPALHGTYTLDVLLFPLLTLAVIALGSLPSSRAAGDARRALARERPFTIASMLVLIVVSVEGVHTRVNAEFATLVHSLRSAHLSRLDNAKLERGYYEGLMSVDRFNSQLWEVYAKQPANWMKIESAGLKRFVAGFEQVELIPSIALATPYGPLSINRWGLRDRDYDAIRPPATLRVAVLGASSVMGWGVPDGASFEALLEDRLNESPLGNSSRRFELLNFGIPGYQPPQQLAAFERALKFQANAIYFVAAGREASRSAAYLAEALHKKLPIPPVLQAIVEQAGVAPGMDEATLAKRLQPLGGAILSAVYRSIGERSGALGIRTVWIMLPQVREGSWQEETPQAMQAARDAGFQVIDLSDVYRGHDIATLRLAAWDDHPNALGHRLVAERLYRELAAAPDAVSAAVEKR
jgi:D-alanyl-lipoteichoic acid acyltransferase DltB (MBOAT superfamily)